jgi:hypothetical protein
MISQERLEVLRFQVDHQGLTPDYYKTLEKTGHLKELPNAPMITVTPWELRQLLDRYEETTPKT